tara:strand:- start:185 stop:571 length:387 start_codon:yes stop_codon:yes gene_type:complete
MKHLRFIKIYFFEIKKNFKNRKTLKFKYLVMWAYGFLIYFFIRPYPSFRDGDVIINSNLYELYKLFPIFIYLIIVVAIILEFFKLIIKDPKSITSLPIILPVLYIAFVFISTAAGYQVIDFEEILNVN